MADNWSVDSVEWRQFVGSLLSYPFLQSTLLRYIFQNVIYILVLGCHAVIEKKNKIGGWSIVTCTRLKDLCSQIIYATCTYAISFKHLSLRASLYAVIGWFIWSVITINVSQKLSSWWRAITIVISSMATFYSLFAFIFQRVHSIVINK